MDSEQPRIFVFDSHAQEGEARKGKGCTSCLLFFFYSLFTSVTFGKLPILTESQDL